MFIIIGKDWVHVGTPYNKEFVYHAHRLDGIWEPSDRVWRFKRSHKADVENLIKVVFGVTGDTMEDTYLVSITANDWQNELGQIVFGGQRWAYRPTANQRVKLGFDVIQVSGSFPATGKVAQHPVVFPLKTLPKRNHVTLRGYITANALTSLKPWQVNKIDIIRKLTKHSLRIYRDSEML